MVNSKKLLSLFLAVVMVFSALTVMASAYTVGDTESSDVNVKYTVEKIDTVPANDEAGSEEYSADNLYAVSIWMKASMGVDSFTAPVHYNKTLFSPITLVAEGATFPYGMGMDQDTYYTDMGEGAIYAYSLGDYMNNTGMYKADGSKATTKALAKCIGLGNSNSAGVTVTTELVSPDHNLYSKWGKGLSADTGVLYFNLDVQCVSKSAYLNTIEGINYNTDWNKMFTVYFEAIAEDVNGADFGVSTADCFKVEAVFDTTGSGYYTGTYDNRLAAINVSGNAVVEASAPSNPIYHVKNQIQWADKAANTVNLGVVAGFDIADIAIEFYNGEDGGVAGKSKNVDKVGAVVTIGDSAPQTNFEKYVYSANDGASYYFRAVIAGVPADYDGDIVVTPLVWMTGEEAPMYGEAITITADKLAAYVGKLS